MNLSSPDLEPLVHVPVVRTWTHDEGRYFRIGVTRGHTPGSHPSSIGTYHVIETFAADLFELAARVKTDWNETVTYVTAQLQLESVQQSISRGPLEDLFPELSEASDEDIDSAIRWARGKPD